MNGATYQAIVKAHGQARHVIGVEQDLRVMQRGLADEKKDLERLMHGVEGHLIGEGMSGLLLEAYDHLVLQGNWSMACTVAMLGRDTSDDFTEVNQWTHRFEECERRMAT